MDWNNLQKLSAMKNQMDNLQKLLKEKEILLNLNKRVVAVKDATKLIKIIIEEARQLIPIDDIGLVVFNKEKTHWIDWAVTNLYVDTDARNELLVNNLEGYHPMCSLMKFSMDKTGIVSTKEIEENYKDLAFYDAIITSKIKDFIYTPLIYRDDTIGSLWFDSYKENTYNESQFAIFESIADILAGVVQNILINEELQKREREKVKLLKISEEVCKTDDFEQLSKTIKNDVKSLFPFDNERLFIFDKEKDEFYELLNKTISSNDIQNSLIDKNLLGPHKISDIPKGSWILKNKISIRKLKTEALLYESIGKEYIATVISHGLKHFISGPLRNNGEIIGVISFFSTIDDFYNESHKSIFKGISSQISIALANILSNRKILDREREAILKLQTYKLFTDKLNFNEILLGVSKELVNFIPFEFLLFKVSNKTSDTIDLPESILIERIGLAEFRILNIKDGLIISEDDLQKDADFLDSNEMKLINDISKSKSSSKIFNRLSKTLQIKSTLFTPILLEQSNRLSLTFFSKKEQAFNATTVKFLERYVPSLKISVEKKLAYERITGLNDRLKLEKDYLVDEVNTGYQFDNMVGSSPIMEGTFKKVALVAKTPSTVLLLGETGTGKELLARAIHNLSDRQNKPFVKVNCAALPPQLLESELFGHEKGSFTGAMDRRIGKFELADKGTIFLDEIGELSIELQSKLLNVLQEKEFERIGSNTIIKSDFRVVAATNRVLQREVEKGNFRADLYFRLNVFPIRVPALRERREDIPLLAVHFLQRCIRKLGKNINGISPSSIKEMMAYDWPGNVREMEHFIERSVIVNKGTSLNVALDKNRAMSTESGQRLFELKTIEENERELIINTLKFSDNRIRGEGGAAQILDIHPNTLDSRMKKLGIGKQFIKI